MCVLYLLEVVKDEVISGVKAEIFDPGGSQECCDLEHFDFDVIVDFGDGSEVPLKQVPDGDDEFSCDSGDGEVAAFFEGEPDSPFMKGRGWLVHGILCGLYEKGAQVPASVFSSAEFTALGVVARLLFAGGQSNVSDEFFMAGESFDIADESHEAECNDVAYAHESP